MSTKEFGKQCQSCRKRGDEKFARMYYEKIGDKYIRVCKDCWETLEKNKKNLKRLHRLLGGKKKFKEISDSLFNKMQEPGQLALRVAFLEIMNTSKIKPNKKST